MFLSLLWWCQPFPGVVGEELYYKLDANVLNRFTSFNRVELSRTDKNKAGDTKAAPYSVMTFALSNLTSSDSGVYTCVVDRKVNDKNETKRTNFSLRVIESSELRK